jgi:hypothetical protein
VRLARKYYGTYASEPFNRLIHDASDMYEDQFTGARYAKGQMTWLVEKGERLPEAIPKKVGIECCCKFKNKEDREFGAVLVGCDDDEAPRRYADNRKSLWSIKAIRYLTSIGAYNICKVQADLSTVPESKFTRARAGLSGEEYFIAEFKLEATFSGGMIEWNFIFDGKSYGSVSVSYDK